MLLDVLWLKNTATDVGQGFERGHIGVVSRGQKVTEIHDRIERAERVEREEEEVEFWSLKIVCGDGFAARLNQSFGQGLNDGLGLSAVLLKESEGSIEFEGFAKPGLDGITHRPADFETRGPGALLRAEGSATLVVL